MFGKSGNRLGFLFGFGVFGQKRINIDVRSMSHGGLTATHAPPSA